MEEIKTKYSDSVVVKYQTDCTNVEWKNTNKDNELCSMQVTQKTYVDGELISSAEWTEESSFVIGADGASSSVRSAMEEEKMDGNIRDFSGS